MNTKWEKSHSNASTCSRERDHKSGDLVWMGTAVDLVFGSNSQLRAIAEVYGM